MRLRFLLAAALTLSSLPSANGRQQTPPAGSPAAQDKSQGQDNKRVVRLSVTLMQIDVNVTDSKGRPVTDLKAEDFQLLQNNKPQHITDFSYITAGPPPKTAEAGPTTPTAKGEAPPPPPGLKPEQVRRAIALVVDDLTLSFESTVSVKQALKKFVDEQMQPGDLVAIIRTGAGMGALQQFTNDKRQLNAAIDLVRWKPGYGSINTFSPVVTDPSVNLQSVAGDARPSADTDRKSFDTSGTFGIGGPTTDTDDKFRQEIFAIGTLGALGFVVQGLHQLPGRKSVVLFSDALRIYDREQNVTRVRQALDNLTDLANRASVSFYTIDARGLVALAPTAADDLGGEVMLSGAEDLDYSKFLVKTYTEMTTRHRDFIESQEGLAYLADRTGGMFFKNNNDLGKGVRRALADQEGYYLLGFVPAESTFKSKNGSREFQSIAVKVNRPGLRVHTRTGFYGVTDEESRPVRTTAARELLTALASPFTSGDIRVRMTSQFWHDAKDGAFVNALLHIDARDLAFEETVNGWRKATFEIAAFTFGDNGRVIDRSDRAYTVSMSDKDYQRTLEKGIFYRIALPIKKPGAYQLRTAVRDHLSKKLGSANQFIEITDIKKGNLALSGLVVRGTTVESARNSRSAAAMTSTTEGKVEEEDPQSNPAVRKFKRGMAMEYACLVYNARVDKATNRPQLETQLRLFRDGQRVFLGKAKPFDPGQQRDFTRLVAGGSLLLGKDLEPGEYALQLIVTDKHPSDRPRVASQWIDFEIAK
ncbi:MAG TPA: VWA domain-containing protein [Blastocatellia bacterium]|nr:VWA domain-containing protein [Blastocatellia bacterium]